MNAIGLSRGTANRLLASLRHRPGPGVSSHVGGSAARLKLLVRCESAVPAASSGVGAQCYPGVVIDPKSNDTTQEVLGNVWLTVLGDAGLPVRPHTGRVYECILSGPVEASTGDSRPRAFTTPRCCGGTNGSGQGGTQPGTFALSCEDAVSGSGDQSTSYTVVLDCAQIDGLISETICLKYAPTANVDSPVCDTDAAEFTTVCGPLALRFLATASIDSINFCCEETLEADIPQSACVQLLNGRRSYASIASTVYLESEFDGFGYPIDYTTPNGKVQVSGRLVLCRNRTPAGWYFTGTISSTDKDASNPDKFDCGCATNFGGCDDDANGVTQQITVGPNFATPSQTLKLTTPCGTLEIKLAGPYPCSPPPPPASYNCISGRCIDPLDGTGVFSSLSACLTSGCQSATYNCISGRCVDPLDGTGTYTSLGACEAAPCTPLASFNCVPGSTGGPCIDPGDGTGTFTSLALCEASGCGGLCYGDYLYGKTGTLLITGGPYDGQTWDVVFGTTAPTNTNAWGAFGSLEGSDGVVVCREQPVSAGAAPGPPGTFGLTIVSLGMSSTFEISTSVVFGGGPGPLVIQFADAATSLGATSVTVTV